MNEILEDPKNCLPEVVDCLPADKSLCALPEVEELVEHEEVLAESLAVPANVYNELRENILAIRDLIEKRLSKDKAKEEAFERLYGELDSFKRDKAFEDNRALFIDLFLFYDRIEKSKNEGDGLIVGVLSSLQEELQEILLRRDIQLIRKDGLFDPAFHKAISTQPIDSPDLDCAIIRVLRDGFEYKGKVLRPQEVIVGRYHPFTPSLTKGSMDVNSNNIIKENG